MKKSIFIITLLLTQINFGQENAEKSKSYFLNYLDFQSQIDLVFSSYPTLEDCNAIFKNEYASIYFKYSEALKQKGFNEVKKSKAYKTNKAYTDCTIQSFSSKDIINEKKGELKAKLTEILKDNIKFYKVKYLKKGEQSKKVYNNFININGKWVFFHKFWKAFKQQLKPAKSGVLIGTWEKRYKSKNKITLSKPKKPFRSIEAITLNTNGTFIHKRTPPCGNDVFFTKKGSYTVLKNELVLEYNGGEKLYDFYKPNSQKNSITKKETITYVFNRLDENTLTLENKTAVKKEEEQKNETIEKGLKASENFGFLKGTLGEDFMWFPAYQITDAWLKQVQDGIKNNPENKKYNVTIIKGIEYISYYIFDHNLPIAKQPTTYFSSALKLIEGKKLKKQIQFSIQNKLNNTYTIYQTCEKTKFKKVKFKDGFLTGKIAGELVETTQNSKVYIPVNIEFKIKPRAFK